MVANECIPREGLPPGTPLLRPTLPHMPRKPDVVAEIAGAGELYAALERLGQRVLQRRNTSFEFAASQTTVRRSEQTNAPGLCSIRLDRRPPLSARPLAVHRSPTHLALVLVARAICFFHG